MKNNKKLTDQNFSGLRIENHNGKSLIIFSADWCPYCISFFNNLKEYGKIESIFIADITDVESKLWDDFDLNVVPTMAIFEEGSMVKKWDGIIGQGLTINHIEEANSFFSKL
jgi:thiol-disulfide isomerase/thioredoxin|tara:strand:- start:671 stop:1006 length:336 start_codon:yes stop_codon:yes gene_type:complete